ILKLRELASTNDGNNGHWPITQPGKRSLCHAPTHLVSHGFDGCDNTLSSLLLRQKLLHHIRAHPPAVCGRVAMIFSRQHAAGKWRPCGDAKIQSLGHWDQFSFDCSLDEAVFNLQPNKWR